jgi:hypothetical protein
MRRDKLREVAETRASPSGEELRPCRKGALTPFEIQVENGGV